MLSVYLKLDDFSKVVRVNNITGVVYFKNSNLYFPDKNWNDSILILIEWWFKELFNHKEIKKLFFMEGNFHIELISKNSKWEFNLFKSDNLINSGFLDFDNFKNEFLKLCIEILTELKRSKLFKDNIEQLYNDVNAMHAFQENSKK